MQYDIVAADSLNALIEQVNTKIKEGWRPQGGVDTEYAEGYNIWLFQAMVKDDD